MRVSTKGQVTIPKELREQAGLRPGTEVEFEIEGDWVTLRKVAPKARPGMTRGEKIVKALQGTRTKNRTLSTEDIMRLLRGDG